VITKIKSSRSKIKAHGLRYKDERSMKKRGKKANERGGLKIENLNARF